MVFRLNNTSKTFGGRAPTGLSTGNNTPILDTLMLLHNCTCITSTSIAECKLCCSNATGFLDAAMGSQEQQQQSFYGPLSGLPGWAGTRRNIHPPSILIIIQSLSTSSIYCNPRHPPCSNYVLGNRFAQPLPQWKWDSQSFLTSLFQKFHNHINNINYSCWQPKQ